MRGHVLFFRAALILLVAASACSAFAQRPKVGLSLAGGGAKGLAHIGILEAIDSAGLKIDCITGTSMGAVVGSLYAAGYSGREIEDIARNIDWGTLFRNSPNYRNVALSEKDEFGKYLLEVPLKGLKVAPSSGLIDPEEIWLKFLQILYPVYKIKDFHQLSIPFECLATDVVSGDPVVLRSGSLVPAVRASMAIPTIFTPVDYQGLLLVDGGLVRNFPVRYAQEMGASYLIGVSLYSGLLSKDKIKTALDVFNQITSYVDAADEVEEKQMCNILISPPMGSYTVASFGDYEQIIEIGKAEGRRMYPVFKRLADSLNAIEKVDYEPHGRIKAVPPVTIDSISVVGAKDNSQKLLLASMDIEVGRSYTEKQLSQALNRAYSTLNFKYVYYDLTPLEPDNHAKITIVTEENSQSWAKGGLSYNSFTGASLDLNYTYRTLNKFGSRTVVSASVGSSYAGLVQSRLLFGESLRNQLQGEFTLSGLKVPFYSGSQKLLVYSTTYYAVGGSFTRYLSDNSGVSVGINFHYNRYSPDVAPILRYRGNERQGYAYLNFLLNTLNNRFFPTQGTLVRAEVGCASLRKLVNRVVDTTTRYNADNFTLSADPYLKTTLQASRYRPLFKNFSLVSELNLGMLFNFSGMYFNQFFFGGEQLFLPNQVSFVGLKDAQIIASSYATAMLGLQTNIFKRVYLLGKVNFGVVNFVDSGKGTAPRTIDKIWGYGLTGGYLVSKLPVKLSVSYSPYAGKVYGSFSLGYVF